MTTLEPDATVQSFAAYLTEIRSRAASSVQQSLSEMSIIRDCITSNNSELTEFKRPSTTIAQQMQSEITEVREKLTNAFGEITSMVQQKTQSDQDMMKEINGLQHGLTVKSAELETLKRSYGSTHQQLQSTLVHVQNNLSVSGSELENVKNHVDQVQKDFGQKFSDMDQTLRRIEDQITARTLDDRSRITRVNSEVHRIQEELRRVNDDFSAHKRAEDSSQAKFSLQMKQLENGRRQQIQKQTSGGMSMYPYATQPVLTPTAADGGSKMFESANSWARQSAGNLRRPSIGMQPLTGPLPSGSLLVQRTFSTLSQK